MIHKRSDFDLAGKLRDSADMVAMKMRNHHIIDLIDARCFSRGDDAARVSPIKSGPPGINKNGLFRWRHDQCCLPALDVDEKDLQGLGFRCLYNCRKDTHKRLQDETSEKATHFGSLLSLRINRMDPLEDINLQNRRSFRDNLLPFAHSFLSVQTGEDCRGMIGDFVD